MHVVSAQKGHLLDGVGAEGAIKATTGTLGRTYVVQFLAGDVSAAFVAEARHDISLSGVVPAVNEAVFVGDAITADDLGLDLDDDVQPPIRNPQRTDVLYVAPDASVWLFIVDLEGGTLIDGHIFTLSVAAIRMLRLAMQQAS